MGEVRQYLPDRTLQAIRQRFAVSEGSPVEYRGWNGYVWYGRTVMLTPKPSRFTEVSPRNPNMTRSYPPPREVSPYTAFGRERK